jgi:hypothetical protein
MADADAKIFEAFANSPHRWRTARAIAKQTGMPLAEVIRFLERSHDVVKARKGNSQGATPNFFEFLLT